MERTDFRAIVTDPSAGRRTRGTQSNMSEHSDRKANDTAKLPPPTRAQRLAAAGFLGAFGLTILTVLLTGLKVGAPAARHLLQPAPVVAGSGAPAPVEASSAASTAAPSASAAPSPSVIEPQTDEGAAARRVRDSIRPAPTRRPGGQDDAAARPGHKETRRDRRPRSHQPSLRRAALLRERARLAAHHANPCGRHRHRCRRRRDRWVSPASLAEGPTPLAESPADLAIRPTVLRRFAKPGEPRPLRADPIMACAGGSAQGTCPRDSGPMAELSTARPRHRGDRLGGAGRPARAMRPAVFDQGAASGRGRGRPGRQRRLRKAALVAADRAGGDARPRVELEMGGAAVRRAVEERVGGEATTQAPAVSRARCERHGAARTTGDGGARDHEYLSRPATVCRAGHVVRLRFARTAFQGRSDRVRARGAGAGR